MKLQVVKEVAGSGLVPVSEIKQANDLDWLKQNMAKNAAMIELAHKLKDEHSEHAHEQVDAMRDMEVRQRYFERRIGQLLAQTVKRGRPKSLPNNKSVTLTELGITENESVRWQKLAKCKDATFDKVINTMVHEGKVPTRNAVIRIVAPTVQEFSYSREINRLLKVLDFAVRNWPTSYLSDLLITIEQSAEEVKARMEDER